jgi:fumarate hydratase, class I
MEEANKLGVGAMGFRRQVIADRLQDYGGEPLPASFFVSVAYECWAFRRLGVRLDAATAQSPSGSIAIRRGPWNAWRAAQDSR